MESKRIFKEMLGNSYVKRFIAIMFLVAAILFMFSSCAMKKDIVYVDRYTDNQVTQVKHDTLREHTTDSIYVSVLQKGDTVYQTKYKEVVRWKDKISGVWKEVSATELNSEEVIMASQGYPYNVTFTDVTVKGEVFEGDLLVSYDFSQATDTRLFAEGSFLANHVQKVNIMGFDVEDIASLPSIMTMIKSTYETRLMTNLRVTFTIDTDTIEGDLFGINYRTEYASPQPKEIMVNCKVKSLDCSHINRVAVSMLNSPTEILEQGSIKGKFSLFILPLALKNLEENAFANNCEVKVLFIPSLTVPESLSQSLSIMNYVYFPALIRERTYKDYVKDVFNLDATDSKVYCLDISTGQKVSFPQS